ncbi:WGR domain-containing protein [Rhodovulum sulfidophilum]|nr:WGR domain-containing protein [Rhodovulum sulfidophilum]
MHLTRTDPVSNLYRFYRMEIVQGLFGDWGLVRNWGRIDSAGQLRTDWFMPAANSTPDGTLSILMRTGMRLARRTHEKVAATFGSPRRTLRVRQAWIAASL